MRNSLVLLLRVLICLLGVVGLALPSLAQGSAQREKELNGVKVGSSAVEVLKARGMPHYIGPALANASAIEKILNPPPEAAMANLPTAAPGGPGVPEGTSSGPPKPKPEEEYIVWMYEGNGTTPSPAAGLITYVIFNKYGAVSGVAVLWTNTQMAPPNIKTNSRHRIGLGDRLITMVGDYDWPEPFARVDTYYFCSYPAYNVTFSLDVSTRKVVGIALGMAVACVRSAEKAATSGMPASGGMPGGMPGPGALPGGVIPPR